MGNATQYDDEALIWASHHYEIGLDEPGAEEFLRRSSAFAWRRLHLAAAGLGREITATVSRLLELPRH
jgi:hypothetical protein